MVSSVSLEATKIIQPIPIVLTPTYNSRLINTANRIQIKYGEIIKSCLKRGAYFGGYAGFMLLSSSLLLYKAYKISTGQFETREYFPCNAACAKNQLTIPQQVVVGEILATCTGTIVGSLAGLLQGHYRYFKAKILNRS